MTPNQDGRKLKQMMGGWAEKPDGRKLQRMMSGRAEKPDGRKLQQMIGGWAETSSSASVFPPIRLSAHPSCSRRLNAVHLDKQPSPTRAILTPHADGPAASPAATQQPRRQPQLDLGRQVT